MKKFILLVLLIVLAVQTVQAAGSFSNYNMTIPRFGGSNTTNNKTKQSGSDPAIICSIAIGGGYTLKAWIEKLDGGDASSQQSISDNQRRIYNYTATDPNDIYHAKIATYWYTRVNVQAIGKWSPDNPGACGF